MPYVKKPFWVDPKDHKELKKKLKEECGERASLSQFVRLMEWNYINDKKFANDVSRTLRSLLESS